MLSQPQTAEKSLNSAGSAEKLKPVWTSGLLRSEMYRLSPQPSTYKNTAAF